MAWLSFHFYMFIMVYMFESLSSKGGGAMLSAESSAPETHSRYPVIICQIQWVNGVWCDGGHRGQYCISLSINIICCCCQVASVMSDTAWPHRRQPTRLRHPWDSPGKNTGVGCHFLLQCMKVKSESEVVQSCPTLRDPMDCSLPGFSVHGIFQARVLEWDAIAFSQSVLLISIFSNIVKIFC